MGSGGAGERPGEAFVAACWGERRRGAHLQGRAAAGGRQGAAGAHPGPAGLPEVGRVVPTDAWQGGCGATAGEKQSRSDPPARGSTALGRVAAGRSVPAQFPGRDAQGIVPGQPGSLPGQGSSRTGSSAHPACAPRCILSTKRTPAPQGPIGQARWMCFSAAISPQAPWEPVACPSRTTEPAPCPHTLWVTGLCTALRPVPSPEVVGAAAGSPRETALVKRGRGWPPIHCQFPWSHW